MTVGILAYGSVIDDPGEEIEAATLRRVDAVTPFSVEFARSSSSRAGAPTLVPVKDGGSHVNAKIFVVNLTEVGAGSMLWRRETGQVGSGKTYVRPQTQSANHVLIERFGGLGEIDSVVYTNIAANITPLTAKNLASLAIKSARALDDGRDGISYLINAKKCGIKTVLSDEYEAEIKAEVGAANLEEALGKIRAAT